MHFNPKTGQNGQFSWKNHTAQESFHKTLNAPIKTKCIYPHCPFLCPNTGFFADPSGIGLSTFSDPLEIIFRVIIAIVTTVSRAVRRGYMSGREESALGSL